MQLIQHLETMTTKVRTETGKVLEVKDFFHNEGKGSYHGSVIIFGEEVFTNWFYDLKAKKISFLTSPFYINDGKMAVTGKKFTATGDVIQMSAELSKRLDEDAERELKRIEQDKSDRLAQMYDY
jgi:hypothetical protein